MPDEDWFDGWEVSGLATWTVISAQDDVEIRLVRSQIEPGASVKVVVYSANMLYLGKQVVLAITQNGNVAEAATYYGTMEPDALGGLEASFLIYGLSEGRVEFFADVDDGAN